MGRQKKKLQTQQAKKKTPVDDRSTDKPLTRQVVTLKKYPTNQIRFYNGARVELPRSRKVYITRESSGLSDRFQKEFEKAGFTAKQIDIVDRPVPVLPDAGGIVLLPDLSAKPDKRKSLQFLTAAFALVKEQQYLWMQQEKRARFSAVLPFWAADSDIRRMDFQPIPCWAVFPDLSRLRP